MKGINPITSHTMAIMFSILLIIVVVTALNSIIEENRKFISQNEVIVICNTLRSSIEELNVADYSSSNSYTSTAFVNLPEKAGGFNYRVSFENSSIKVETTSQPLANHTCKVGFNLTYTGSSNGGKTRVDLTINNDGSKTVELSRG